MFLKYSLWFMLITSACSCGFQSHNRLPPLTESYRKTDKLPFGSFIAYKGFEMEFPDYWINVVNKPFDKTWDGIRNDSADVSTYSLYFLVTKNLLLSNEETDAMMAYVKAGNDLFISADYIDPKLLKALYCTLNRKGEIVNEVNGRMKDTHVSMYYGNDFRAQKYSYYYFPFSSYVSSYDTSAARVLGVNEMNLPDYIVMFPGKGRLYLHLAPRAFSNYFLLTNDNFAYFEYVTAYLRFKPQYIYWDEYYKGFSSTRNKDNLRNRNDDEFSSLRVIEEYSSLWWAFCIAVAGMVLLAAFAIKRKQRVIEVIKPESNTTVAFAETIGRLYLQQKDNKNIAEKRITYFYERLRRKYFINTSVINEEFINSLSGKSGVSLSETNHLFEMIKKAREQEDITDEELIELNAGIEKFKK